MSSVRKTSAGDTFSALTKTTHLSLWRQSDRRWYRQFRRVATKGHVDCSREGVVHFESVRGRLAHSRSEVYRLQHSRRDALEGHEEVLVLSCLLVRQHNLK